MSATNLKNVTVQLTPDLLALVDAAADKLDLNRSQYFRRLVRKEFQSASDNAPGTKGEATQQPAPPQTMERAA